MYYFSLEHRSGPMEQTWFADASGSMPDLTIDQDKLAAVRPFAKTQGLLLMSLTR